MNYNTPRPRPIDPAVFFDLIKIRRLVDEATKLAVRSASGVVSLGQKGLTGAAHQAAAFGLAYGQRPPPQAKLSGERRHRMREQATQKLAEAYRLEEIASSVASMQGASSLERVASEVLERNPQDVDATYVHFFHQKIPSRKLNESTPVTPLDEVVAAKPSEPGPLRTRGVVRFFKGDCQGAVDDLTEALKIHRLLQPTHSLPKLSRQEGQLSEKLQQGASRRHPDVILKDAEQPSSMETQLLFQRAGVHLVAACSHVAAALPADADSTDGHSNTGAAEGESEQPRSEVPPADKETQRKMAEARRLVRLNAKRALRDYMAYIAHFEYSPDLHVGMVEEFTRKVNSAIGGKTPRFHSRSARRSSLANDGEGAVAPHRVYALSDLFASSPPPGLPPYPSTELVPASGSPPPPSGPLQTTTESVTYNPLLIDGLHALLLCHCLIQTPVKELVRHAYMAARLARLADGYPVLQASRCPARTDWIDVLRVSSNWIQLSDAWEELCAPTTLPLFQSTGNGATPVPVSQLPSKQPKTLTSPESNSGTSPSHDSSTALGEPDKQLKDRNDQQAAIEEFVTDDPAVRTAIQSRQLQAEHDYRAETAVSAFDATLARVADLVDDMADSISDSNPSGGAGNAPITIEAGPASSALGASIGNIAGSKKSHAKPVTVAVAPNAQPGGTQSAITEDGREILVLSDRASAIARWVMEVPLPSIGPGVGDGPRKRRKKPVKKAAGGLGSSSTGPGLKGGGDADPDREGGGEGEGKRDDGGESVD